MSEIEGSIIQIASPTERQATGESDIDRDKLDAALEYIRPALLADEGADHQEILERYYSGAEAAIAGDLVPDEVMVGLETRRSQVAVAVDGPAALKVNGIPYGSIPAGTWTVRWTSNGVALVGQPDAPVFTDRPWPR